MVTIRVIGQDATSGAIGTLTIPIKQFLAENMPAAPKAGARKLLKSQTDSLPNAAEKLEF